MTTLVPCEDRYVWTLESDGVFSVASIRKEIDGNRFQDVSLPTRWVKSVPIKVNIIAWKVKSNALPTRFNISRRGMDIDSIVCPICNAGVESTNHIFFQCVVVRQIMRKISSWWNIDYSDVNSYEEWRVWLVSIRIQSKLKGVLEGVYYGLWWYMWNFRNKLLFDKKIPEKALIFDNLVSSSFYWCKFRFIEEPHGEGDSDHYLSDESYFSHQSSDDDNGHDDEDDEISSDKVKTNSNRNKSITMKENSKFQNVHDFRRALNHHVIKSDGDANVIELRKWLTKNYNVNIPYHRVFRGKEQAYTDMYGKWDDSFIQMGDFKEELQNRNPGSVVDIDFEMVGDKKCFKRFFISLAACFKGFLAGCRPYISLDACHLKGRFNGVLAAAIGIDGNNGLFPIAYGVLESKNGNSWTWFLESLKKAIGTSDGLVISSDMQRGLDLAIMQVYPNVEHIECMRHLYSNFKKKYRGDFFKSKLWGAANTYCVIQHERLLKELSCVSEDAISFLSLNHNKIWSRSKFGTASKCDYITNNVSEAFNAWIGPFHFQPVIDLLDNIREELLKRFNEKRMVVEK
ncbi:RNA-directed DNA polymerase, eukaryota [Tanacetum coccineum]